MYTCQLTVVQRRQRSSTMKSGVHQENTLFWKSKVHSSSVKETYEASTLRAERESRAILLLVAILPLHNTSDC